MTPSRVGVFLRDDRATVVAVTGRDRLEHFIVEAAGDPAQRLAAELRSRRIGRGRLRLGLDRRLVIVKVVELPRAEGGDIARMLRFDLERHVPYPAEAARFDWMELATAPGDARRMLVMAAEARAVEPPLALVARAQRSPAALTVACHGLLALLPRALPRRRAVWAHRHDGVVDLVLLDGRTLLTSRQVQAAGPADLGGEIRRSLPVVRWRDAEEIWLSGDDGPAWRETLGASLAAPVTAPPFGAAALPLIAALPPDDQGAGLLALAVALGPRRPALDLLPNAARPWAPSRAQLVTAGMLLVTGALALSLALTQFVTAERYLGHLSTEIARLEPDAKAVDGLSADLGRKRRVLAALAAAAPGGIPALPVLRELTEILPAGAWLQSLALARQGVELTGQADGAGALIPLLEASSRLERVELTSPVTRAQDKEQFRVRAAWESPHPSAPDPAFSPAGRGLSGSDSLLSPGGGEDRVRER